MITGSTETTQDNIKIYLDDLRQTPVGWIRTFTVEQTIKLIKKHNGHIHSVSLDNDLGTGLKEGREVMLWIEKMAFHDRILPIPILYVHSGNPVAVTEMYMARNNAWKFWKKNGRVSE